MVIELGSELIVEFKDRVAEDLTVLVPGQALKEMDPKQLHGLPIYFRVGAVKIQIGFIHKARKGRDAIYGDVRLDLKGHLEVEVEGEGKARRAIPQHFIYKKVAP